MGPKINFSSNKSNAAGTSTEDYYKKLLGADKKDIQQIAIGNLTPFPNQPFKAYKPEKLQELAEDIKINGVLSPVLIRPYENSYQILSGHNRVNAAKIAGLTEVPCIVKDYDDNRANLVMVNTNLNQREELLPSEKAFAYKIQMEAMKENRCTNGAPNDESEQELGCTNGAPIKTRDLMSQETGVNREQIRRYIRLTYLLPDLLDKVDDKDIPFRAGVNISYLDEDAQKLLVQYLADREIEKINLEQSEEIKDNKDLLDYSLLDRIFCIVKDTKNKKEEKVKMLSFKIPKDYFKSNISKVQPDEELLKRIVETIDDYYKERENK